MATFEDREKSYEAKWAHDEDVRFRTFGAAKQAFLGLWAAAEMGLFGGGRRVLRP